MKSPSSSVRPTGGRPPSVTAATAIQKRLRKLVISRDDIGAVEHIAVVDVGINQRLGKVRAAAALFCYPELVLISSSVSVMPLEFPYVPGYLSFRELPAVLSALDWLEPKPDLLLCDGHGLAHPRRFGLACHLGIETGITSIGVGKTRLVGTHERVPTARGAWTPLVDLNADGERLGAVLRSRANVAPIYVSTGHRISLETAIRFVMGCVTRYRLPETTRAADRLAAWR